ncbi:hypothetical protein ACFQZT_00550 [Paenibacillus sp. GCM10027628]|uniref:hypothetical protein n=1 Tax=Paenibacillus sp. GCM10027628 TaxID=3273413 RepID=UPI0036350903
MNWFEAYKRELADIFAVSKNIISKFPAPLDQLGLTYLSKFDATKEDSTKNYICYLLPFWMSDLAPLPQETIKKLSLANVFVMLYFFIQDDVMDSPTGEHRDKLPLGNLFYLQYLSIYRELFPSDSAFWTYFDKYVKEWSEAVSNESNKNYFMNDIGMVAKKASPVKFASTGALVLSNQSYLILKADQAINQVLVTLQMLDDWADWPEDMADGAYNCLLSLMSSHLQLPALTILTSELVKQQLYVHDFLTIYAQIASKNNEELKKLELHIPQLFAFHDSLVNNLLTAANEITTNREKLALGGFNYFLSRHVCN